MVQRRSSLHCSIALAVDEEPALLCAIGTNAALAAEPVTSAWSYTRAAGASAAAGGLNHLSLESARARSERSWYSHKAKHGRVAEHSVEDKF